MRYRGAVSFLLLAAAILPSEAQDSSQENKPGSPDAGSAQENTNPGTFSGEYYEQAKKNFIKENGLETLYDMADPALKDMLDNIIFKVVFGVKEKVESENRDAVKENGFIQLKKSLLPELIAKKKEQAMMRVKNKQLSVIESLHSPTNQVDSVNDENKSMDQNGFMELKKMLLSNKLAKKKEMIKKKIERKKEMIKNKIKEEEEEEAAEDADEMKEHSISDILEKIGITLDTTFDTSKSIRENLRMSAQKIISELKQHINEDSSADSESSDESSDASDDDDDRPDVPLPYIDYDDLVDFFRQFEPQIEEVIENWDEYLDAVAELGDLITANDSRAGFDYDKALRVYEAAENVIEKKREWIESLVQLGEDIVQALLKKTAGPNLSVNPLVFMKAFTFQTLNRIDTTNIFSTVLGNDFSSEIFKHVHGQILSAIDIDDLKDFLKQFDSQIQYVNEKWEDYLNALKDLNDLLNTTDSRAGFDYDRALQIFQAAEEVLKQQEEWMQAVIDLQLAIADALRNMDGDYTASIDSTAFHNAIKSLQSSFMTLPRVVEQYEAWYNDPERASKPFVYKTSDVENADDGIQLSAASQSASSSDGHHNGASSGETAMIVLGCVAIVAGVSLTGAFMYRRRQRSRLYTRLPPVWEKHELSKTTYSSADATVQLLPAQK